MGGGGGWEGGREVGRGRGGRGRAACEIVSSLRRPPHPRPPSPRSMRPPLQRQQSVPGWRAGVGSVTRRRPGRAAFERGPGVEDELGYESRFPR